MLANSGRLVALAAISLLSSSFAHALSQRAFVSAGGVDNPSCSLSAPCRSFTAAIAAIVSGGEVVVLDSAGYGPVTITQSASIIAPPGIYAGVSVFTGNGVTVNGAGVSVVLRGLAINGLGGDAGIVIQDAARVRIENCVVARMSHMGIFHQAAAAQVTVSDTIVRDNAEEGIRMVTSTGSITLERVAIEGNQKSGLYISPNAATGRLTAGIVDSSLSRNLKYGIWADAGANATVVASIDRSTLAENGSTGVLATGSSSAFVDLAVQRSTLRGNAGSGIVSFGSSPATIVVNALENVLQNNFSYAIVVNGSGAAVRASGNSYGSIECVSGGTVFTYQNNSMVAITSGCPVTASFL